MGQSKIKQERRLQRLTDAVARPDNTPRVNPDLYQQASASMTPEQIEEYKQMGEEMYNTVDFNSSEILNNPEDPLAASGAYIAEGLKSGMHPAFLDTEETLIMEECYGKEWFKKFGYESLDE